MNSCNVGQYAKNKYKYTCQPHQSNNRQMSIFNTEKGMCKKQLEKYVVMLESKDTDIAVLGLELLEKECRAVLKGARRYLEGILEQTKRRLTTTTVTLTYYNWGNPIGSGMTHSTIQHTYMPLMDQTNEEFDYIISLVRQIQWKIADKSHLRRTTKKTYRRSANNHYS